MRGPIVAACVAVAAVVVAWPPPGARARARRVLGAGRARHRLPAPAWRFPARLPAPAGRFPAHLPPPLLLVVAGVVLAALLGGVVAGVVAGAYGTVAARVVARRGPERNRAQHRAALLDALGSAAADLRAGLPAGTALAGLDPASPQDPLLARVRAAVRLAERTGAPLAEVLERIEADARAADRARAAAAAQAAGSAATAWMLAALPAGGIGLGYAIGTDPLAVLLHTPLGAACAVGAVTLQLAGLAWARRITRPAALDGAARAVPA